MHFVIKTCLLILGGRQPLHETTYPHAKRATTLAKYLIQGGEKNGKLQNWWLKHAANMWWNWWKAKLKHELAKLSVLTSWFYLKFPIQVGIYLFEFFIWCDDQTTDLMWSLYKLAIKLFVSIFLHCEKTGENR